MALSEKEKLLFRLQLAENAERYTDMIDIAKRLTSEYAEHLVKEGELCYLTIAYKNSVDQRMSSWRIVLSLPPDKDSWKNIQKSFCTTIEGELVQLCSELVDLIDQHLLKVASTPEVTVSLLKTQGDYTRYMAEIQTEKGKSEETKKAAGKYYEEALHKAEQELSPAHPEKLGLALNMSVFYYETVGDRKMACQFAKKMFDSAVSDLEHLEEKHKKSSTLTLQILQEKLTLWTSEDPDVDSTA